jgi:hypothetical protein
VACDLPALTSTPAQKLYKKVNCVLIIPDPDPGSGAFLTPESGIRNRFFPDPGSQTHIFESLVTVALTELSATLSFAQFA